MRFSLRRLFVVTALIALALGMLEYSGRWPYYESRGGVGVYQPQAGVGVEYYWSAPGFNDKYSPQLCVFYPGGYFLFPDDNCRREYQ